MKNLFATAAATAALFAASGAYAAGHSMKIGVMATLEGTYTVLGEDGVRGIKTALAAFGGKAGGKEIELVIQSTDASPDSAVRAARKLVELGATVLTLSDRSGFILAEQGLDQPQDVFWGEGSLDEMCMALLGIAWQP